MVDAKRDFGGSIPDYYDRCLGPAYFDIYARDLSMRLPPEPPGDVLEIACGTGLVTRRIRERLDPTRRLVATDLSPAMLDYARQKLDGAPGIEWRTADAAVLPFAAGEFGAVVCAFGLMFVPDRMAAVREAARVLKRGGAYLFSVWDRVAENPHAAALAETIDELFPGQPDMQYGLPYEMNDPAYLRELLDAGGFREVEIERKRLPVGPIAARTIATGQIRGTPRSALLESRGAALSDVIEKLIGSLAKVGGDPYRAHAQALMVTARAPA